MSEPPPLSQVVMMRRRLPDGYALVSKVDLETVLNQRTGHAHLRPGVWDDDNGAKAGTPCAECAARARLSRALRGELTAEEQEGWDAYAAERQATAKPDGREAVQALIDASTERAIRAKVAAELHEWAMQKPEGSSFRRHLIAAHQMVDPPTAEDAARALQEIYEQQTGWQA